MPVAAADVLVSTPNGGIALSLSSKTAPRDDAKQVTHPNGTLMIVLSATFMQLLDVSIVNVAIPSVQRELHASYAAIQFVVAGYQLAFASGLITAARLGDIFGRKKLFVIGMIGFTAASVVCGAAPTAGVLIAGRVLLGLMSGIMFPQVLSIIQVTFAPQDRGRALGLLGTTIGLATIVGPLAGGSLIALNIGHLDWRLVFYVNVPIGVLASIAAILRLEESRSPDAPRLDISGAILITGGLFLLVYPLTEGRQLGWPIWGFIVFASALPVLVLFLAYEGHRTRLGRSPLIHRDLFKDRSFTVGLWLMVVFFSGVPAFFFVTTLYLQIGFGFSPLHAGLTTFPFAVGTAVGSIASDKVARRLGKRVLLAGSFILVTGMSSTILAVHLAGYPLSSFDLLGSLIISGLGLGLFVAPLMNLILAGIRSEAAGSASGVLSTGQQVGGVLGMALIGVVFFGLLGSSAANSTRAVTPELQSQLAAAGLPPNVSSQVVSGFTTCFNDRARASDPTATPPSCRMIEDQVKASPAPPAAKARVVRAVQNMAVPKALAHDFGTSYAWSLLYEAGVFALAFLAVFALPNVSGRKRPDGPGVVAA